MATTPTTPTKKTTTPKAPAPYIPKFAEWAAGRTGFSQAELQEVYALTFGLTPDAIKTLEDKTGTKSATTLTPAAPKKPGVPPQVITRPAPDLLITRTPYPKWWNDLIVSPISIAGSGSQVVAGGRGGYRLFVATIAVVVSGEGYVSFGFGGSASTGSFHLGGGTQPSGIVISMSDSPAPCGAGGFSVSLSLVDPLLPPTLGGFAVCFSEANIEPA